MKEINQEITEYLNYAWDILRDGLELKPHLNSETGDLARTRFKTHLGMADTPTEKAVQGL